MCVQIKEVHQNVNKTTMYKKPQNWLSGLLSRNICVIDRNKHGQHILSEIFLKSYFKFLLLPMAYLISLRVNGLCCSPPLGGNQEIWALFLRSHHVIHLYIQAMIWNRILIKLID